MHLADGPLGHLGSGTNLANFARTVTYAMAQQKASARMNELIRSLQQALGRLEDGKLGLAELEQSTADARAIYERFVVLRHKAREAAVGAGKGAAQPGAVAQAAEPAATDGPAGIRLQTRPAEASPQQTSLIDAIAETETSAAGEPAPGPAPPAPPVDPKKPKPVKAAADPAKAPAERPLSVADRMVQAPVADLRKAIALSQKFWFVAELFEGDRKRYEEAIDALNAMGGLAEAEAYVQAEITAKQAKPPGEEVAAAFMELLQRRFR